MVTSSGAPSSGVTDDTAPEGKVADEPAYVARTYADSPDIDGYVFVNTGEMLMSGDFVKVKITGSAEYDLIGELV